jgi:hypothetical protein
MFWKSALYELLKWKEGRRERKEEEENKEGRK